MTRFIRTPTGIIRYDNNFSDVDKDKLDSIEYGAQVNTILGIKGSNEKEYRVGYITISKDDIGLNLVDNTADIDKNVNSALKLSKARNITIENQTVLFDGSKDINFTLNEIGAVSKSGDTINGNINVTGDSIFNSINVSGNTELKSTLDVTGATTLNDILNVIGAASFSNNLAVSGTTKLKSTLDVTGATTLNDILNVTGSTSLNDTLTVSGTTKLKSTLDVTGNTTLKGKLDVVGDASITGILTGTKISATTGFYGDLEGNASSANILKTARKINGTLFNGNEDITTIKWGAKRQITIGGTTKIIDGSEDVVWDITEIGVSAENHTHLYAGSTTSGGAANSLSYFSNSSNGSVGLETANNAIGYINGISLFGQTDGALFVQRYSEAWKAQLFIDYRTGQVATRGKNNGTWQSWRTQLDSGNYNSYALPLSGGTLSGNLTFSSVDSTAYPAKSNKIVWSGSTDGAEIYYQVDASDAGRLVLNLTDDTNTRICFALNGTIKSYIDANGNFSANAASATLWNGYAQDIGTLNTSDTWLLVAKEGKIQHRLATDFATANHTHNYLPLSGGTMTGSLEFSNSGTTSRGVIGTIGDNDYWRIIGGAGASNSGYLEIATADDGNEPIYVRQYSSGKFVTLARTATLLDSSGNTSFPGTVSAKTFSGALSGNASTATKLATARTITLSGSVTGSASFDGSGNITISTSTNHSHSYLPLSGGTVNGTITFGSDDTYGIRTSMHNYVTIGESSKRFYRSYINYMNGASLCLTSGGSNNKTEYAGTLKCGGLTYDRTYTLPNKDGTVALTSDLASYLPLSGGSLTGDLTINGSLLSINIEDSSGTGHAPRIVTKTISEASIFLYPQNNLKWIFGCGCGNTGSDTFTIYKNGLGNAFWINPDGVNNAKNHIVAGGMVFVNPNDASENYGGYSRVVYGNGIYGFVNSGPGNYIHVNTSSGAYGVSWWASDTRLKKNIYPTKVNNALDKINQIDFIEFDWKDESKGHVNIGLSANQLEEIIPEAVFMVEQDKNLYDVEYDSIRQINDNVIDVYALKAIQELSTKIKELEDKLSKYENAN